MSEPGLATWTSRSPAAFDTPYTFTGAGASVSRYPDSLDPSKT